RDGDPGHGAPALARRDLGLGGSGLPPRQLERGRDERARLSVEALDARDQCVRQLDRRELAGRDELRELGDREVVQLRGHGALPLRVESSGAEYSVDAPAGDGYPWAAICAPQAVSGPGAPQAEEGSHAVLTRGV